MVADRRFSIADLDPEAYALAEKAARAAGIGIEEWITRAIVRKMSAIAQTPQKPQAPAKASPSAQPHADMPSDTRLDAHSAPVERSTSTPSIGNVSPAGTSAPLVAEGLVAGATTEPLSEKVLLAALNAVSGSESGASPFPARHSQATPMAAPEIDPTQRHAIQERDTDLALPSGLQSAPPHDLAELKRVLERLGAHNAGPSAVTAPAPSEQPSRPPFHDTSSPSHAAMPQAPSPETLRARLPASGPRVQGPALAATVTRLSGVNIKAQTAPASADPPSAETANVNMTPMKSVAAPSLSPREPSESENAAPTTQGARGQSLREDDPLELDEPITEAEAKLLEEDSGDPWQETAASKEKSDDDRGSARAGRLRAIAALILIAAGSAAAVYYWPNIDAATGVDKFVDGTVLRVERTLETAKWRAIIAIRSNTGTKAGQPVEMTVPVAHSPTEAEPNGATAAQTAANPAVASTPSAPSPASANGAADEHASDASGEVPPVPQAAPPAPDSGSPSSSTSAQPRAATAGMADSTPPQIAAVPPQASTAPAPPTTMATPQTDTVALPPSMKVKDIEALAKKGDARAQHDLGALYARGDRVPQDYSKAFYWFREAALQGVASAQYNLGVLYDRGLGVEKNPLEALLWYLSAAEQGHVAAQYNVGTAYSDGKGVPKNYTEARKWLTKAAEQGLAQASYSLGVINELGLGANADPIEAYAWYKLASRGGESDAEKRLGEVAATLSPAQIAEANKRYDAAVASIPLTPAAPADRFATPPLQHQDLPPAAPGGGSGALPSRKSTSPPAASAQPVPSRAAPAPLASTPSATVDQPSAVIADIQRSLGELGYNPGPASGRVDLQTAAAIREFQKEAGLPVDGQATPQLLHFIKQLAGKS